MPRSLTAGRAGVLAAVLLLVLPGLPAPAVAEAIVVTEFANGSATAGLTFPEGGGWNNSTAILLPAGASVEAAGLNITPVPVAGTGRFTADALTLFNTSPLSGLQLKGGALELAEGGWWWQAEDKGLAGSVQNGTVLAGGGLHLGPALSGRWAPEGYAPVARIDHAAVWDQRAGRTIVYGGWNLVNPQPTTVDIYDPVNDSWTQKASGIPNRIDHSAVWDDQDGVMLVFGGTAGTVTGELWTYSPSNNTWARKAGGPPARSGHSAVWDGQRARMLVFGGSSAQATPYSDLWAYSPALNNWTQLGNRTAPALSQHTAVWDPAGERMVVFGGADATGQPQNQTWTYDARSDAWNQNLDGPTPRQMHTAVFADDPEVMLVYGGFGPAGALDDLWSYDSGSDRWTRLMAGGSYRGRHASLWMPDHRGMLMLGGWSSFYNGTDIWSYRMLYRPEGWALSQPVIPREARNVTLWANLSLPPGTSCSIDVLSVAPSGGTIVSGLSCGDRFRIPDGCTALRLALGMSTADANLTPVLHGWGVGTRLVESMSSTGGGLSQNTESDGQLALASLRATVWEEVARGPSPRYGASCVWDPDNGQFLVFGGTNGTAYFGELYAYLPSINRWFRKPGGPTARAFHSAVWDPDRSEMIVFGGLNPGYQRDLWTYSPLTDSWTYVALSPIGNRARHCAAWDSEGHAMLVFGGSSAAAGPAQYMNTLHSYQPSTGAWAPRATVSNGRHSASAAWDLSSHRMLVFAGRGPGGLLHNDLWSYCPANDTWELRDTMLSAREGAAACHDPSTGQMLVSGGSMGTATAESWHYSYSGNLWSPAPSLPSPAAYPALACAGDRLGVLAFGGQDSNPSNGSYLLASTAEGWTLGPAAPAARTGHTSVWDGADSMMLVFGGAPSAGRQGEPAGQLWAFRPGMNDWISLASGAPPRVNHSAAWDPGRRQMLVFGGSDGTRDLGDLWAFRPASGAWAQLAGGPPARSGASAVWCTGPDQMVLFGGINSSSGNSSSEVWAYLPGSDRWVRRPDAPVSLAWHSAAWDDGQERMLVYGGSTLVCGTGPCQGSLWEYHPDENRWAFLGSGATARKAAAVSLDPDPTRLLVLGGENGTAQAGGLWYCSLPRGGWRQRPGGPTARSGGTAVWDAGSGRGYFFGGTAGAAASDELWSWGPTFDTAGSYLSPARDLGSPASLGPATISASVPAGTALKLYLRSSQNNLTWSQWEQLPLSGGPVSTTPQRYLQWRAFLTSERGTGTPALGAISIEYKRYVLEGSAGPFLAGTGGRMTSATVRLDGSPRNGTAAAFLSADGGTTWVEAPDGVPSVLSGTGQALCATVRLGLSPDGMSPLLRGITVDFGHESYPYGALLRAGNATVSLGDLTSPSTLDISGLLAQYLAEHPAPPGQVAVPLQFFSAGRSEIELSGLWVVVSSNRPPSVELSGPPDMASFHASSVALSWTASDPDGDPVRCIVRWSDRPLDEKPPIETEANGSSLVLSGLEMNRTYFWTVRAGDGAAVAEAAPGRRFSTVNAPPSIDSLPPTSALVGRELVYRVMASDPDGDSLEYRLLTPLAGMSLGPSSGELRWTPDVSQMGTAVVSVQALDPFGAGAIQDFTLQVSDRYQPPRCLIESPAEGGRFSRPLVVSGLAIPGSLPVLRVEVRLDSGRWAEASGTGEWRLVLNTSGLGDGRHTIEARAFDGTAFSEAASVNFTFRNPSVSAVPPLALLAGAALALAGIFVAAVEAFLLVRRRRARDTAGGDAGGPGTVPAPPGTPPAPPAGTMARPGPEGGAPAGRSGSPIVIRPLPDAPRIVDEKEATFLSAVGDEPPAGAPAAGPAAPGRWAAARPPAGEFLVEDVFLMYMDGRLILHTTRRIKADLDLDLVTSMLRAVQIFVRESLGLSESAELGSMEYGENKIVLQKGRHTILAAVVTGEEPAGFRDEMRAASHDIEGEFEPLLEGWNGLTAPLAGARRFLTRLGSYQTVKAAPESIRHDVLIQSDLEFYQGFVRVKIAVKNRTPMVIRRSALRVAFSEAALRLDHIEPEYATEGREILLGDIEPREKKSVALYLDPQICTESHLEGLFVFLDAGGRLDAVKLPRKLVSVVCPILFTEHNINVAMLKRMLMEELVKKDSKVFSLPAGVSPVDAFFIGKAAVEHHDLRLVRELVEPEPLLAEAWYFGQVKGREDRLVARIRVLGDRGVIEFHVASSSTLLVTGLLAELKSDLNRELEQRKLRDRLPQVTAAEQVEAIRKIRSLLDKAAESEGAPGETDAGEVGPRDGSGEPGAH